MRFDPVPTIIAVLSIVIIALFTLFAAKPPDGDDVNPPPSTGLPQLSLAEKQFYLSPKVVVKQKDLSLANSGSGTLIISALKTSCSCITAQFIKSERKSSPFADRSDSKWQDWLEAEETAYIRIIFDEKKFDWQSPTEQWVSFKTNDQENKEVKIDFLTSTDLFEPEENQQPETKP